MKTDLFKKAKKKLLVGLTSGAMSFSFVGCPQEMSDILEMGGIEEPSKLLELAKVYNFDVGDTRFQYQGPHGGEYGWHQNIRTYSRDQINPSRYNMGSNFHIPTNNIFEIPWIDPVARPMYNTLNNWMPAWMQDTSNRGF